MKAMLTVMLKELKDLVRDKRTLYAVGRGSAYRIAALTSGLTERAK